MEAALQVDIGAEVQGPGFGQLDDLPRNFAQKLQPQAWVI